MSLRAWLSASFILHLGAGVCFRDVVVQPPIAVVSPGFASSEAFTVAMNFTPPPEPVEVEEVIPDPEIVKKELPKKKPKVKKIVQKRKVQPVVEEKVQPKKEEIVEPKKKVSTETTSDLQDGARWIRPVVYISNVPPRYPSTSRRKGEEGLVILKVLVREDGKPSDISIHKSSGYSRLDSAALDSIRNWAFRPAERLGQKMAMNVLIPVKFELRT